MNLPLTNKKALIVGVANERSLAWGIAQKIHALGGDVGFNFQNDKLEKRVRPLAESVNSKLVLQCDVNNETEVEGMFDAVKKQWGGLDILIHSVAYAERADLEGRFVKTSREGFRTALEVSAYSLISLAREAEPLMEGGGSILTLSYYGADRVVPNYNIMGVAKSALESIVRYLAYDLGSQKIRVNAISAGPVKTLAAAGIRNFRDILGQIEEKTPLRENISADDVGELAAFLCTDGARHITGSTLFVDSGAHIMA